MDMQPTVGRGLPVISYEQMFEHYKDKIFSFAWKILRSKTDTEEAVQETFLKLYINFERLDPAGSVSSLIFTTAKNICIDMLRKRKTKLTLNHPMMKHEGWEDQASAAARPPGRSTMPLSSASTSTCPPSLTLPERISSASSSCTSR